MATAVQTSLGDQLGLGIPTAARNIAVVYMQHAQIHPDPDQPREEADAELRDTIATSGILQPLAVRPAPWREGKCEHCGKSWEEIARDEEVMIVFGERRWRGAEGVQKLIPVMIRSDFKEDAVRLVAQAAENAHKSLTPLEEARQYTRILEADPTITREKLAGIVGKPASTVKDRLALLRNRAWVPLLEAGEITVSQAVEVSRYADHSPYPEDHEAPIENMRLWAALGQPADRARIADRELAWFREHIERAYAPEEPAVDPAQTTLLDEAVSPPLCEDCGGMLRADGTGHYLDCWKAPSRVPVAGGDPAAVDGARTLANEIAGRTGGETVRQEAVPQERSEEEASANPGRGGTGDSAAGDIPPEAAALPAPSAPTADDVVEVAADAIVQIAERMAARSLFLALAPVAAARPVMITIGAAAGKGRLRVTILAQRVNAKDTAPAPLIVEGTPEELDAELAPQLEAHFAGAAPAGLRVQQVEQPAAEQRAVKKAPAKKTTPKKAPAKKAAVKKKGRGKSAARSTTKAAEPAAPTPAEEGETE